MKNTLNKKSFKHKKLSSPLAIATVMLSGAAVGNNKTDPSRTWCEKN